MRAQRIVAACIATCALSSGCTVATRATVATFTRVGNAQHFRGCTLRLGWTTFETTNACGAPLAIYKNAANAERECFAYATEAQPFSGARGARYLIACFGEHGERQKGPPRLPTMIAVYGVASLPLPDLGGRVP